MVTKGQYTDVIYRRYEVKLEDRKEEGLVFESYARTASVRDPRELVFIRYFKKYGTLSEHDLYRISHMRSKYREERFTCPVAFMDWLIEEKVSDPTPLYGNNNNVNKIQAIHQIEKSKQANCVDIGIVVYKMCSRHPEFRPSTIATVSWIVDDRHSDGHVFALFKYKHNIYVFDYDQTHFVGELINYKSDTFNKASTSFCFRIKQLHPNEDVRNLPKDKQLIYVLDSTDLQSLNNTSEYANQKEWLKEYSALYQHYEFNKQRRLVPKNTIKHMWN